MRFLIGLFLLTTAPVLAAENRASIPIFFIEDSRSHFVVDGPDMRAAFTSEGAVFQARESQVRVRFGGANARAEVRGAGPMGHANFLIGSDPRAWRRELPAFQEILYRELYPGIDAAYSGAGGHLKSEFRVAPGADPGQIRLEYSGNLSIDAAGSLHAGNLREQAPLIYQDTAAGRVSVNGRYRLFDARTAGFEIQAYDQRLPLVIDPVISYATYLGGTGQGAVTGVAVDSTGNLYATGWTEALNFPIVGAEQAANQGGVDVFVVKLNAVGSTLLYATYIGGRGEDKGAAIAVDGSFQAYVTGSTASTNFPLAAAIRSTLGGSKTAFALKLNAVGNTLLYSTYLGGTNYETGNAIAVDGSGNAYIAGDTQSANFPVLSAVQSALGGGSDAFVAKFTASGALAFSTFLGGAANEHAGGIAVDASGSAYIAGGTTSTDFPVVGAIQGANAGNQDVFVTKLSASGAAILYSTYLGGNGGATAEQANGIAVDSSGAAYVTGVTNSANFPVTAGAYQTLFNGVSDAFVARLNTAGSALVFSAYLGGTDFDWANGIRIDGSGNAYVAGYTFSTNFPVVNGVQAVLGGIHDAFVTKISAAGSTLSFSTYYGGSGSDSANAIAVDASGNMYVGGQTASLNLPLASAIQSLNNGGTVGWLARLGVTAPPVQTPSVVSVAPASGAGNAPLVCRAVRGHRRSGGADHRFAAGGLQLIDKLCVLRHLQPRGECVHAGQRRSFDGRANRGSRRQHRAKRPVHADRSGQLRKPFGQHPDSKYCTGLCALLCRLEDGVSVCGRCGRQYRVGRQRRVDGVDPAVAALRRHCLSQRGERRRADVQLRVFGLAECVQPLRHGAAVFPVAHRH